MTRARDLADSADKDIAGTITLDAVNASGVITGLTVEATGDTAAGDNAAMGYTAAEGLILTGQGSTSDITLKNDADAVVFTVPTGTDDILFPDNAKAMFGAGSDLQIYHDGTHSYISDQGTGNLKILGAADVRIVKSDDSELSAKFVMDGAVELYHNNVKTFETTATGIDVTGTVTADGLTVSTPSNGATMLVEAGGAYNARLRIQSGNSNESFLEFADPDDSDVGEIVYSHSNNSMRFNTNATERMRIDSAGAVIIGDTDSGNAHANANNLIIGSTSGSNGLTIVSPTDGTGSIHWSDGSSSGNAYIQGQLVYSHSDNSMRFYTAVTEAMRIDSSGRVLIGTTTEGHEQTDNLTVSGSGHTGITIRSTDSNETAVFFSDGTSGSAEYRGYLVYRHASDDMRFGVAGSERMRIDSSGIVLIAKTGSNVTGATGFEFHPAANGGMSSTITSGNTYHVHNTSAYTFYVASNGGVVNFSANNTNLSDRREKKNIELLDSQWDSLKQWSLKKFHYNADDDSDNKKYGVIAQEVEIHNPEVIGDFKISDETNRMAVKEQQMMWLAIKALQEAQTRIEELETKVAALEG